MKSEKPDFASLINNAVHHMDGKIDLSYQQIEAGDLSYLITLLKTNHQGIRTLDLSGNKSIGGVVSALKYLDQLESLQLIDCALVSRDIDILAELIKSSAVLKSLDLSGNDLEPQSFSVLALALRENYSLETLELRNIGMSSRELKYLIDSLNINTSLKSVDICGNVSLRIADIADIDKFTNRIIFNRTLSRLDESVIVASPNVLPTQAQPLVGNNKLHNRD